MSDEIARSFRARVIMPHGIGQIALDKKLGRARQEFYRMFGVWPAVLRYPKLGGWHSRIGRFATNYGICPTPSADLSDRTLVFESPVDPSLQSALEHNLHL